MRRASSEPARMARLRFLVLTALLGLLAAGPAAARPTAAIFYYPWYGTAARDGAYLHWEQNGRRPPLDLASHYYPARGPYLSADTCKASPSGESCRRA